MSVGSQSCVVTKGTTPTTIGLKFAEKGIPFLRVQNVIGNDILLHDLLYIDEKTDKALSRSRIKSGDVLVSIAGTIGRTAVVPLDAPAMNCNQAVAVIRLRETLNPRYFCYWLSTDDALQQITGSKVTATISNLSLTAIKELQIPFPPLPEQHRIATILDKADAIRRKRQEALALTDEFLRSAFLEMFGDPVTNPKGWPVVKLEETFSLKPQIGTIVPAQEVGQQIVVRVGELGDYNVALERSKRVTLQGSELKRFELIPGDFLLARAIGSEEHLGKASVLQPVDQTVVFDSHVMRLRFKEKYLDPMFFLQWLRTEGGRALFMRRAGRTAVQFNINARQISDIDIPLPEFSFQKEFRELFTRVRCLHQKHYQSFQFEESLFNSLTQRAFRGEL